MSIEKLLRAKDSLEALQDAQEMIARAKAEKAKPIPLVATLTGREIHDSEGVDITDGQIDEKVRRDAVKSYFDKVLRVVEKVEHPFLGTIYITGKTWKKNKLGIPSHTDKILGFAAILDILQHGKCALIETVREGQKDEGVTHFAYLLANVKIAERTIEFGLSVAINKDLDRITYNLVDGPKYDGSRDPEKYKGVEPVAGYDSATMDQYDSADGGTVLNLTVVRVVGSDSSMIEGRNNKVKTAKGTRLDTTLAVIEADDLIASHDSLGNANPDYPQELQPRDRSRQSSQQQIHNIAKELDPDSLGRSNRADSGAPIIGPDRVVESGNGRTIAIKLAYQQGKAEDYRDWIVENADYFGFSAEQVQGMKQPVLVRVRKTDVDRAQFALEANQDDKLSYSATERAKSDAKRITGPLLELFNPDETGNLIASSNMKFIQGFLASLGEHEAAQYMTTDGKPTQALVMRIKSAIFSKAYNDDRLLEMVADQTKPELQNVLNALSISAPKFIEAQAIGNDIKGRIEDLSSGIVDSIEKSLDQRIVNAILDATNVIEKAKFNNQAVTEYVDQLGLFGDLPEGVPELSIFISENARSAKKLSIAFKALAEFAEKNAVDSQNLGLFGEPEPVSIKDAVAYANQVLSEQYGDKSQINMFDSSASAEILESFGAIFENSRLKNDIAAAVDQTATNPDNSLPEPTDQDKQNDNYLKGKFSLDGLDIAIENPAGSIRSGTDENGDTWENEMQHHYGYIEGTQGADGDELDVFIHRDMTDFNGKIFVIDQLNPVSQAFDEHKLVVGVDDAEEAKAVYLANYEPDWKGLGQVTEITIDQLRNKLGEKWHESIDLYDDATNFDIFNLDKNPVSQLNGMIAKQQPLDTLKLALECLLYRGTTPAFPSINPLVLYTTKKGKILEGIVIPFDIVKYKKDAAELDPYTFQYERAGWFIRMKHLANIDDSLLTPEQILLKQGKYDATDSLNNPSIPGQTGTGSNNTANLNDEQPGSSDLAGQPGGANGASGHNGNGTTGVSESHAAGRGNGSNQQSTTGRKRGIASTDFAAANGQRSNLPNEQGSSNGQKRDRSIVQSAQTARTELTGKALLQQQAEGTPTEWGDAENIRKALPYLLDEQHDDVFKAEDHLLNKNQNGILFTNGTGTGKTFTGLGIAKRFANAGMGKILIVSMNDKIVRDFVRSAKALQLDVHQLKGIDDNGGASNIVATTYANLGQNSTLADKDWDFILVDESHNLMQSEDANVTAALKKLRALSGHHSGFYEWFDDRHRGERPERVTFEKPELDQDGNPIKNADGTDKTTTVETNEYVAGPALDKWLAKQADERDKWLTRWNEQPKGRTKVVFLSATPWSYIKTIEWAEGYLFHYSEPRVVGTSEENHALKYNSGNDRQKFFMQNFGYTMRYNKLTRPDGKVNSGVNEREFANKLKKDGAMSGRELVVPFDYDRRFILIKSAVGQEIDRGIEILWSTKLADGVNYKYGNLLRAVLAKFNYLSRERLLEAIKADAVVDQVKKSIALGRKVVVFHDYNEGGGFSPFNFEGKSFGDKQDGQAIVSQYEQFKQEYPELVNLDLSFSSPITTIRRAFPNALLFNGRVSKGERAKNADLFNTDDNGYNVIMVQSDAGATGISFHDTTGKHQRVIFNLGLPKKPAKLRQTEGRIYRVGQASNAIHRYLTTGTKWETSAFAQTIAQRAETVDNLAKGDDAVVSIRDAIINAYENAEYFEPSLSDGIGGKAYDEENARIARLSPFDKAMTFYHNKGKNRHKRADKIGQDWYATPEPLGLKMVQWAGVHKGDDVLEPSAGDGAIGRWIPEDANGTMIEPSQELASRAQLANTTANIENGTFENHNTMIKYDAIVMNPPFGHAGSLALEHVIKAAKHLREGGRIVALVPRASNFDKGLEAWQESSEGKEFYVTASINLPPSTFENANTSVNTRIVILERHADPADAPYMRNIDFSSTASNIDLFEQIRDLDFAPRKLRNDEALMEYGLVISPYRNTHILTGEGVTNPEIRQALTANWFVYEVAKDPNTLECNARNMKKLLASLKDVPKLFPHTQNGYDSWQHDGIYDRILIDHVKVDLQRYVRREKQPSMRGPIVVQEIGQHFILLSGYERFRLAKERHEQLVPAIVLSNQYMIDKNSLAKAYRMTAIPLDPELFAHNLLAVLDDEAVKLLA